MAKIVDVTNSPMLPGADGRPMSSEIAASAVCFARTKLVPQAAPARPRNLRPPFVMRLQCDTSMWPVAEAGESVGQRNFLCPRYTCGEGPLFRKRGYACRAQNFTHKASSVMSAASPQTRRSGSAESTCRA